MRRLLAAMLLSTLSCAHAAVSVDAVDVGERYQFSRVQTQIQIANPDTKAVPIREIVALHAGDRVLNAPTEVAAGATATATVELWIENDLGNHWHVFDVQIGTDKPQAHLARAHVFGMSLLDEPRPLLDFGVIDAGQESAPQSVKISSQETTGLKATKILSAPDSVTAKLSDDGSSVIVSVSKTAPWGIQDTFVKVALNSPQQTEAWIEVRTDVHGTVVPSSNPYSLDVVRSGAKNEFLIRLDNRDGKDFQIDNLMLEGVKGTVDAIPCIPKKAGCRIVRLKISDAQETGKMNGKILVGLPDFKRRLPIVIGGMFLKAETKIVSLDDKLKKSADSDHTLPATPATISDALKKAVHPPVEIATPAGNGPLLKWNVANEQNIYGYLIYRSDSDKGPFERVNKDMVRVMPEDNAGATYKWRDNSASPGKTYWYYVGLIYNDGRKHQLSSPQKILAK